LQLPQSDSSDESPTSLGGFHYEHSQTDLDATETADVTNLGDSFQKMTMEPSRQVKVDDSQERQLLQQIAATERQAQKREKELADRLDDTCARYEQQIKHLKAENRSASDRAETELAERSAGQVSLTRPTTTVVSDSIIAPKPFTGRTADGDPEGWLEYFKRYCKHRQVTQEATLSLFKLLMRDAAADWLSTVSERANSKDARTEKSRTYAAFRDAYLRLKELRWKQTGDLWGKPQTAGESVEEYMVRVRRSAKRLDMKPEAVYEAVLNGLRPNLRLAILALKPNGLDELVRSARLAQAVAPTTDNTLSASVMEVVKASTKAQERQAAEMGALHVFSSGTRRHHQHLLALIHLPANRPHPRLHCSQDGEPLL